jgi:hypothetical protein
MVGLGNNTDKLSKLCLFLFSSLERISRKTSPTQSRVWYFFLVYFFTVLLHRKKTQVPCLSMLDHVEIKD